VRGDRVCRGRAVGDCSGRCASVLADARGVGSRLRVSAQRVARGCRVGGVGAWDGNWLGAVGRRAVRVCSDGRRGFRWSAWGFRAADHARLSRGWDGIGAVVRRAVRVRSDGRVGFGGRFEGSGPRTMRGCHVGGVGLGQWCGARCEFVVTDGVGFGGRFEGSGPRTMRGCHVGGVGLGQWCGAVRVCRDGRGGRRWSA
jgi:hypothetical protein